MTSLSSEVRTLTQRARRRRWIRAIITLGVIGALALPIVGYGVFRVVMQAYLSRLYLTCYQSRLQEYLHRYGNYPATIHELNDTHLVGEYCGNQCGSQICEPGQEPVYRPCGGLGRGRYLVFIEQPRPEFYLRDRLVIYVNGDDGSLVDFQFVSKAELAARVADDDRRRAAAASQPAR